MKFFFIFLPEVQAIAPMNKSELIKLEASFDPILYILP
jgi:hypothetical protein